jgi:Predicted nucleotide-binding protein containing TIR-like domain
MNTAGGGMMIIESLERKIGKAGESRFGIVLLIPDDVGYAKRDGEKEAKPRARQNVIMEMGMLLSSLARERVAILVKGFVELPSDAAGIIYLHFNGHVKEVVPKLAERLQAYGIPLHRRSNLKRRILKSGARASPLRFSGCRFASFLLDVRGCTGGLAKPAEEEGQGMTCGLWETWNRLTALRPASSRIFPLWQ